MKTKPDVSVMYSLLKEHVWHTDTVYPGFYTLIHQKNTNTHEHLAFVYKV